MTCYSPPNVSSRPNHSLLTPHWKRTSLTGCSRRMRKRKKIERFNVCDKIENVIRRWLLSLPKEAYRSPLLTELRTAVSDTSNIARQRATLTLLAMIAQELTDCPKIVFETLIPPLLALTHLPAIGPYKPDTAMAVSSSLDVADLRSPYFRSSANQGLPAYS